MTHRKLSTTLSIWLISLAPLAANEGGEHHQMPLHAEGVLKVLEQFAISNSMIMSWIATILIVIFAQVATRKVALIPSGFQNFAEWIVESLYTFFEGILGSHLVKRTFWYFGGTFIFILLMNWIGLLPGVGTITFKGTPLLRGGNADVNMTLALGVVSSVLWIYWSLSENGIGGMFKHIFAPKGKFGGIMLVGMIFVFAMVGVIELISIAIRPIALSLRLYGNVYAGENMLEIMPTLVPNKFLAFLPALPFYFMEILVGFIQALVFVLLTSVFLKMMCEHDHDDHHDDSEGAHH